MRSPLSVTELNIEIKSLIESHFMTLIVEGEVSRVTYHASGHLYFTLKDDRSSISCVMFKGDNRRLKFQLKDGMHVVISGAISLYTPRGSYQINCESIEPAGGGALALAYEQLKEKLKKKGYFRDEIKKSIPKFPKHIVVITSKTSAALQDILNITKKRWPLVKLTLIDTVVQGEKAASIIATNIKIADKIGADVIIIARGGGSLEDLWAFNEEIVADAIYKAKTATVSAIGHQIDFLISDFVADLRAPTPSAAIELTLPDRSEILIYIDSLIDRYNTYIKRVIDSKNRELSHQKELLKQNSFERKIELYQEEILSVKNRYVDYFTLFLSKKESALKQLQESYSLIDPSKKDRLGYAQISVDGKLVSLDSLKVGDIFSAQDSKVEIESKVLKIENRECLN